MTKAAKYKFYKDRDLGLTPAMRDLMLRRTLPFLDGPGLNTPLTQLLQEAYLQGMTDAVDAIDHRDNPPAPLNEGKETQ